MNWLIFFNIRFGGLPAVADVELGGRTSLNLCAHPAKSSSKNQSWPRHSLFFLLERLDRGNGNALSALVRHDYERNLAGLLVRRERRVHFNAPNLQSRVANSPRHVGRGEITELAYSD